MDYTLQQLAGNAHRDPKPQRWTLYRIFKGGTQSRLSPTFQGAADMHFYRAFRICRVCHTLQTRCGPAYHPDDWDDWAFVIGSIPQNLTVYPKLWVG
jgi:hypothetical protein